ncbi:hypothetical protein A9Q83_13280 [Alphaproteobacteria bacterium 46_93_T64]|nr:hypothetical protein A9Q83_13280 [Alphaproteobacteria bacterium 46_93_T64]
MNDLNIIKKEKPEIPYSEDSDAIFNSKILVVDDSALIRELFGAYLTQAGYTDIQYAENGQHALDIIDENIPDLVILDLEMPIMGGFEVCRILKSNPETKHLPILIQSGRDTASDLTKAFSHGASDMVLKPIKRYEILARVKVHLENRILVSKLTDYHDRVASELEQARQIQLDICPSKHELKNYLQAYGLDIGWHYEPSSEIGGDIGGILPIDETRIAFYIADFSGHGVAAALNTFRLQTWLTSASELYSSPDELLTKLNSFLHNNLSSGSYATMLFFCLDIEKQELTYSAAGSQPPLLQGSDGSKEFELLSSKGMPLGLRPHWDYENIKFPFEKNTKILIYSDALVEVEVEENTYLGEEGLRKEVSDLWHEEKSTEDKISQLVANFHQRMDPDNSDDLTIICLENVNELRSS